MYIGVDIGGTNITAGIIDQKGNLLYKDSIETNKESSFDIIVKNIYKLILDLLKETNTKIDNVLSIGLGSPGLSKKEEGIVAFANNLDWYNVPLRSELRKYFDIPIYIENDANTAALAESMVGACKGFENSITLTLGTGLGSGIILNGKPYSGVHGVGSELGHIIVHVNGIQCTCGAKGCLERYASATSLIREGRLAASNNKESLIFKKVNGDLDKITAKTVIDSAKENDKDANDIFDGFVNYLAMGIISIINSIDPSIIALGGGVAKAGDFLLRPLKAKVSENIFYKSEPYAEIVLAELGNDAGVIGAAMLGMINR